MKKIFAVLLSVFLLSASAVSAAGFLELDPLEHYEYMRGETIVVTGSANVYVVLGLYEPEAVGGSARYIVTLSPAELAEGLTIETDTDPETWPDGVWRIVVQSGELREELEFDLSESVDRSDEPEPTEPTERATSSGSRPSGNNTSVSIIELSPSSVSVEVGKTAEVSIEAASSSLSVEVDDAAVASASISGKTLTVRGLKTGKTDVYVRSSSTYSVLSVSVTASLGEEQTEPQSEEPTENASEVKEISFSDITGHWAEGDIVYLAEKGIVSGMSENEFMPDENVTRAQFVTMLANAFSLTSESGEEVFSDVKKTDWYFASVSAAKECGVANGSDDGKFNPNSLVTREDMAVFAYRAAKYVSLSFPDSAYGTAFEDENMISDYAKTAVREMSAAGIINGMTDALFLPGGTATRAQAAKIISQMLQKLS